MEVVIITYYGRVTRARRLRDNEDRRCYGRGRGMDYISEASSHSGLCGKGALLPPSTMARGGVSPFPLDIPLTSSSSSTDKESGDKPTSPSSLFRPPSLILPQPVQRLLDFGAGNSGRDRDMVPTRSKSATTPRSTAEVPPLLTIKLSGPSFLDTIIRDTVTKDPLYIVETARDLTHVYRLDASHREAGKAASIQWPQTVSASSKGKGRSGKTIQMSNGSWRDTDEFLKAGPLGNLACVSLLLPLCPARTYAVQIKEVQRASLSTYAQVEADTGRLLRGEYRSVSFVRPAPAASAPLVASIRTSSLTATPRLSEL